jgi:hypothetical protein
MSLFGHRCLFCGLYIKRWQRARHETWHADQVESIRKLLCAHCLAEHRKDHKPCGKMPDCRCVCNAFGGEA